MLRRFLPIFFLFFLLSQIKLTAQDLHFTRYDLQPLVLNPANTGAYSGSFRVTAIYRDQWSNILPNQFTTPSLSIDAPLAIGLKKEDWIGVGVNFFQDQAGIGKLTTTGFNGFISYHLALDKKRRNVFTVALNGGSQSMKIGDINEYIFEDQGQGQQDLKMESSGGTELGAGLMFTSNINETDQFRFGIAAKHLLPIEYQLTNSGSGEEGMQFNIHGNGVFSINDQMTIEPAVVAHLRTGLFLGYGQAQLGYRLAQDSDFRLMGGLGYRVGDAVQVLAGLEYKSLRVGVGYDLSTSPLSPAQSFEIGVRYIGKIFKRPKVKEVILCPAF